MKNPIDEKEFGFSLSADEYRLVVESLLELPGKITYTLIKKIEKQMVDQNKPKDGDSNT